MNIKNLQMFIHLCDSKNFSKTAAAMHISPSSLSRQIQKLEEETSQSLFVRDNRSVELTPAGNKLVPVALKIITEWQQYNVQMKNQSIVCCKGKFVYFAQLPPATATCLSCCPIFEFTTRILSSNS